VFEDCKHMMVELKDFSFKTLHLWTVAFEFNISSVHVSWVVLFALFNNLHLLIKKQKNYFFQTGGICYDQTCNPG
jgi:hypothetical protein